MKKKDQCPHCKGTGEQPAPWAVESKGHAAPTFRCQKCNGSGERKIFEMIFWPYDKFPYLLASPGFMEDNGTAYVPAYQGHFRPVKVLALDEGKVLWKLLEGLQRERNQTLSAVEAGWKARLDQVAPWRKRATDELSAVSLERSLRKGK